MIVLGKVVLKCPETGEEVVLHRDCMNKDGKGECCRFFRHFGFDGPKVAVTCSSKKWQHGVGTR